MTNKLILVFLLVISTGYIHAQSKFSEKFMFSISAGPAIPIGVFAQSSAESAALMMPGVPNPWVIGFDKSQSGFAQVGWSIGFETSYSLSPKVFIFFHLGQNRNEVNQTPMENKLIATSGNQRLQHDPYTMVYANPGIGYQIRKGNLTYRAGAFVGVASMNYPYYESELTYINAVPHPSWAHFGSRPRIHSLNYGMILDVVYGRKKLRYGIQTAFQAASIPYQMTTKVNPGISPNPTFNDEILVRLLQLKAILYYDLN